MRLSNKVAIPTIIALIVTFSAVEIFFSQSLKNAYYKETFLRQAESITSHVNRLLSPSMFLSPASDKEAETIQEQFNAFDLEVRDSYVGRLTIWNTDQNVVYSNLGSIIGSHSESSDQGLGEAFAAGSHFYVYRDHDTGIPRQSDFGAFIDVFVPIIFDRKTVGVVEEHIPIATIDAPLNNEAGSVAVVSALFLLTIAAVIILIVQHFVVRPIKEIIASSEKIRGGNFEEKLVIKNKDEIGSLALAFDNMRRELGSMFIKLDEKRELAEKAMREKESVNKRIQEQNELLEKNKGAMFNILEDIAASGEELKKSNVLIEKQKERAESILRYLKSIGESVFVTDVLGKVIFMNKPAETMTGQTFSQTEGRVSSNVFSFIREKQNEQKAMHLVEKTLDKKVTVSFSSNTFLVKPDGERIPVSGTCSLVLDTNNGIIGTITVFRDVTKLYELDQMKNSFLSVAAHQLRTPLGSMRWSMELLMNDDLGKLPKAVKDAVKQIYDNSGRMITLVNDLLDVSRIDSERGLEEKKPVDIVSVLKEVIKTMSSEAKKRSVKIIFAEPKESIPALMAPPKHLYEALENLVSNGIKYNKEKGTLTIAVDTTKDAVLLTVADTGIGIPAEDQEKIFSKFFRAQNAVLKETEGSGLGLSVVKSYLEESHAKVSFESMENVGTKFFIEFPLGQVES